MYKSGRKSPNPQEPVRVEDLREVLKRKIEGERDPGLNLRIERGRETSDQRGQTAQGMIGQIGPTIALRNMRITKNYDEENLFDVFSD